MQRRQSDELDNHKTLKVLGNTGGKHSPVARLVKTSVMFSNSPVSYDSIKDCFGLLICQLVK